MSFDGTVQIEYGAVESVGTAINQFTGQMRGDLEDLQKQVMDLIQDGFKGLSSDAFHAQAHKWNQGATDMTHTLDRLASKVGEASGHFQQTDSQAAQAFM